MSEAAPAADAPLPHRAESRTARIMDTWRRSDVGRLLVPMEAAMAWPIPYRAGEKTYLILPFYIRVSSTSGKFAVFPWVGGMTLEWVTQRMVEYVDYRFRSPWAQLDFRKPIATSEMPNPELAEKAQTLASMYDELADAMAAKSGLPPFWMSKFKEHVAAVIEPAQHVFYRQIAPKFSERFL
jgi:hypothetical protein